MNQPLSHLRAGHRQEPAPEQAREAYARIDARDNADIVAELLKGDIEAPYLYLWQAPNRAKPILAISAAGARALAQEHGHITHRFVASVHNIAGYAVLTSYPHGGNPAAISSHKAEGRHTSDSYRVIVEMTDTTTGLSLQVERAELEHVARPDDTIEHQPYYQEIARSKAYRNGVLALVPPDIIARFIKRHCESARAERIETPRAEPQVPAATAPQTTAPAPAPASSDPEPQQPRRRRAVSAPPSSAPAPEASPGPSDEAPGAPAAAPVQDPPEPAAQTAAAAESFGEVE